MSVAADAEPGRREDDGSAVVAALGQRLSVERPLRTASLIVTLFGDAIVPRGGRLSIRALIDLVAGLGIEAGAVRTAMSRLVADGLFVRQGAGRRPVYALSANGERTFAGAFRRVYAGERPQGASGFRLVVLPGNGRRGFDPAALIDAGYRPMLAGLYVAHGSAPDIALPDGAFRLDAAADSETTRRVARDVLGSAEAEAAYRRFSADFGPVAGAAITAPQQAFVLRMLAVHAFRRAVIHDPGLPDGLLSPDRPDLAARRLMAQLYRTVAGAAEAHLDAVTLADREPLAPLSIDLATRFPLP
ncbi:PaaX family transcriptional regulator C-terminal domain-containing protein [Phreatobacter sp.]|uniref:PaaX family transcriptional regulator C-terminal domain-containing protein n=1 Tax=Phreatobacter sp. TaxID=1966341 RepID=UPI003F714ABE